MEMRVLLIDDDKASRQLIAGMVAMVCPGTHVEHYDPVEKGCPGAEFGLSAYDLVLLDYRLGHEDGLEWLRELRSRPGCPPIVMITGQGDEMVAVRAIKLGAADYLAKQRISGEVLARVLQEARDARRRQAEGVPPLAGNTLDLAASTLNLSADITHPVIPPVMDESHLRPDTPEFFDASAQDPRPLAVQKKMREGGLRIEGYRVIREIGEGAASHVYLVAPEGGGDPIIAKVLLEDLIHDEDTLARFLKEYQIVGRIKSPYVAKIFGYGFSDSSAYILMEYLPGGDMREYFTSRMVDQGRILGIFRQVLMALGDIHAAGVVHRDLKPHNIMFRGDGSVALVDFGIAKILGEPGMTQFGTLLGTPTYMSPEAITGGVVNARSDLYSAGVMLYQMLAKTAPFKGSTAHEVLEQHVGAPVPPLPRSHDDFQGLIDVLLAKDPEARPASAKATLELIDRLFYE
jgi:eukaryotic-like serine/threonine-protein kinase